jgi:hypothetical protein
MRYMGGLRFTIKVHYLIHILAMAINGLRQLRDGDDQC